MKAGRACANREPRAARSVAVFPATSNLACRATSWQPGSEFFASHSKRSRSWHLLREEIEPTVVKILGPKLFEEIAHQGFSDCAISNSRTLEDRCKQEVRSYSEIGVLSQEDWYIYGTLDFLITLIYFCNSRTDKQVILRSDAPRVDWPWIENLFTFYGYWPKNLRRTCGTVFFEENRQKHRYNLGLQTYWKRICSEAARLIFILSFQSLNR